MGLFSGKKGLILGVANDFSIAWAIARKLRAEGADLGFTHLPGDKMERRVRKLADPIGAKLITPCNVQNDDDVARVFDLANVFSVAAVQTEDLAIRRGGGFELIGRAQLAEPRGCSLMTA